MCINSLHKGDNDNDDDNNNNNNSNNIHTGIQICYVGYDLADNYSPHESQWSGT
jgi:hypothetical protein